METPRCALSRVGAEVPLVDGYGGAMETYGSFLKTQNCGGSDDEIVSVPLVQGPGDVKVQVVPARIRQRPQESLLDCDGVQVCLLQRCEDCGLQDSKEAMETHRKICSGKRGKQVLQSGVKCLKLFKFTLCL